MMVFNFVDFHDDLLLDYNYYNGVNFVIFNCSKNLRIFSIFDTIDQDSIFFSSYNEGVVVFFDDDNVYDLSNCSLLYEDLYLGYSYDYGTVFNYKNKEIFYIISDYLILNFNFEVSVKVIVKILVYKENILFHVFDREDYFDVDIGLHINDT